MTIAKNADRPLEDNFRAPIAEAMNAYERAGALAFHTPGHKQGLGAHPLLRELITAKGLREEVSLMEELDDLHEPTMCIKEAEALAANLYGADRAYFMINGTTGAIHTMLMAVLNPNDKVLVPRNAHRSMIGGIILAGAEPVYMDVEVDNEFGIPLGVSVETIKQTILTNPTAKAIALVYPSYYGVTIDLAAAIDFAHEKGLVVLVDEAHGAHLKFSDRLPNQAIDLGADIVAQSTHKIVGSLTQTSILLAKGKRIDYERLREAASLLASTSPNQLLLASLDIARLQLAETGKERVNYAVKLANALRIKINAITGLRTLEKKDLPQGFDLDLTKITVNVRALGISGVQAEKYLRYECKIQCELSDAYNVLFIISYADTAEIGARLLLALKKLAAHFKGRQEIFAVTTKMPTMPKCALLPRQAFFAAKTSVNFKTAAGKISAEQVMFYPPGIPILSPGDRITKEILEYILAMQGLGLKVVGPKDTALKTIKVVQD